MEEKERYKWSQDVIVECPYEDYDYIVDTENNIIFSDDNYFKLVDLLNQQDKRTKELEKENRELHTAINLSIPNQIAMKDEIERLHTCIDNRIAELEKENQQLKQQLALTEKALELACANLYDINFQLYNTEMNFMDYFKQQAEKEMMKSE